MFLIAPPEALSCKVLSVDINEELPKLIVVQLDVVLPHWTLLVPLRIPHPVASSHGLARRKVQLVSLIPYEGQFR